MAMPIALPVLLAALFCLGAVAESTGNAADFLTARRLSTMSQKHGHIWGRCDRMDRTRTGCNLKQQSTCSDNLSPGPDDADVEIRIGTLPNSTADHKVHLQWWSPRESRPKYLPLSNPLQCQVYRRVLEAYPKYTDDDFNGGNVLVDENGEAVIRVRAPATYQMHRWIAMPHVHLRVCDGERHIHGRSDTLYFTDKGPVLVGGCNNPNPYTLIGLRPFDAANSQEATTMVVADLDSDAGTATTKNGGVAPDGSQLVDLRISTAQEKLDLDALEFSPVYQCLLEEKFFDHFSSDCIDQCPQGSVVSHGQCVNGEASLLAVTVEAAWSLVVDCDDVCWNEKKRVTLHHLRLSVADHLNIPFQEVEHVVLGLGPVPDRRLAEQQSQGKVAHIKVKVVSRRLAQGHEDHLRNKFIQDPAFASELLGLQVFSVVGFANAATVKSDAMGKDDDPYAPAYDALSKNLPSGTPGSVISVVPIEALIACISAFVFLVGGFTSIFICYRRRRAAAQEAVVRGKQLEMSKIGAGQEDPTDTNTPKEQNEQPAPSSM